MVQKKCQSSSVCSGLWQGVVGISKAIYKVFFAILNAVFRFLKVSFEALKNILLGVSALIAAVAFLILSLGAFFYLFGEGMHITDSASFREARDFLVTTKVFLLQKRFQGEFEKEQAKLTEDERYTGKLPFIITPKNENEKNMSDLFDYLKNQERKNHQ